jgi:hypothetical protein
VPSSKHAAEVLFSAAFLIAVGFAMLCGLVVLAKLYCFNAVAGNVGSGGLAGGSSGYTAGKGLAGDFVNANFNNARTRFAHDDLPPEPHRATSARRPLKLGKPVKARWVGLTSIVNATVDLAAISRRGVIFRPRRRTPRNLRGIGDWLTVSTET